MTSLLLSMMTPWFVMAADVVRPAFAAEASPPPAVRLEAVQLPEVQLDGLLAGRLDDRLEKRLDGRLEGMQDAPRYEGRLSVVPVDFSTVRQTSGSGWVEAWIENGALRVEGSFEGTPTPATDAELRRGPPGVPGPVVADLEVQPDTAGAILGEVELADDLEDALRNGHLYVLVRTEGNPEGEIRGWIVPPDFPGSATASRMQEASR